MLLVDCRIPKNDWDQQVSERNGFAFVPEKEGGKKPGEDAGPWEPAVREIVNLEHLEPDWDDNGAKAPSREILESALGLAYLLHMKGVPAPCRVAPGIEGEVIFEWQDSDGTYIDIEIVRPFYAEVMLIEPGKPAKHWTLPTD